jgi:mRNA interferase RelE/StbE
MRARVSGPEDPRSVGEPLKGNTFSGLWRYHVGDYRVLCDIQDEKILVVLIEHGRDVYKTAFKPNTP